MLAQDITVDSDYSGSNTAQPCEGEQQPLSMYPYNQYW